MATYDSHQTRRMEEVHGAPLASFWRRAAAFAADILVMSVLFTILALTFAPLLVKLGWLHHSTRLSFALNVNPHGVVWVNWYSVALAVAYFSLATFFGKGRTPGKALLGIRVVSLIHARLSFWHSMERALGYGASMLELGFGFLQYFINPNKRTVHDRIADTIVVRDPARWKKGGRKRAAAEE